MQVIARKRMQFHRAEIKQHPISGENQHIIHESFTVAPNASPQEVPDWIVEDGLFELAVNDETLVPVAVLSKPAKAKAAASVPVAPATPGLPTGWGAKAN